MGDPSKCRSAAPGLGSTASLEVGAGQPALSSAKLKLTTDQIVTLDGVTRATACRQINEMLNFDLSGCCCLDNVQLQNARMASVRYRTDALPSPRIRSLLTHDQIETPRRSTARKVGYRH